jgi:5-methyltetrahydropteroyltriglutamate--homocysteine methyltransferase
MVPEYDGKGLVVETTALDAYLAKVRRGIAILGKGCASPVVVSPVTLAYLTTLEDGGSGSTTKSLLKELLPVYTDLLAQISALSAAEIQIHEAALVMEDSALLGLFKQAYPAIVSKVSGPDVNMVSFMEDVCEAHYKWLVSVKEFSIIFLFHAWGHFGIDQSPRIPCRQGIGSWTLGLS